MEMNMFVPQSIQTQLELANIADVKRQIISPRHSKPIIEFKQDTPLGSYLMTYKVRPVDFHDMMNLAMYCNNIDIFNIKKEMYDTQKLYSLIIPSLINYSDGKVNIVNGKLLAGAVTGGTMNSKIVNYSWDRHGPDVTKTFYDNAQRLITNWLLMYGFSVGLGDATTDQEVLDDVKAYCEIKQMEVDKLITEMENNPDTLDPETFEQNLYQTLKASDGEITKKVYDNLKKKQDNNFFFMIESKSKGSPGNIGQIIGGLGQNVLEFKRIKKKVNNRTLPHFFQNDDRGLARGFIPNSFYHGLTPTEFYFHHMTAREGMIDTAIKSVTGDTSIVILENGITQHINIGDWIDNLLNINAIKIQHMPEKEMELLELDHETFIPTTDLSGNVSWGKIKNIIRHDPGKALYEIKTSGGRKVIVTESHSLLIWNEDTQRFERKSTPLVKVGDFVPTTSKLIQPPIINTNIDITQYFPKTKYIYGTEFNKAHNMIIDVMKTHNRMPPGWWEEHNNKDFILPYNKIQRFMRVIVRSNIKYIKNNCIYPFTKRCCSSIYEKFEFTEDNGLFLGLYIAEGNSHIPSGCVCITNCENNILDFCKKWFNENDIKWKISSRINNIGGTSTSIVGYSRMLAIIMQKIAGHGARNKFISPECFNAPESFIKQLINGIFSGDGTVTHNSIQIGSSSHRLIEDINMCLTRLNIFGKVTITKMKSNNLGTIDIADINLLSIRAQWAKIYQEKISLLSIPKNDRLKLLNPTEIHRNFTQINDVVLDTIIEINNIDITKYPKVYDLTVPTTLNFGLANGLHVVDTSESGYLQRKLIKGLEDLKVAYDKTVRSGNNVVMQLMYGDNGISQTHYKENEIKLVSLNDADVKKMFSFSDEELNSLATEFKFNKKDFTKWNNDLLNQMKVTRDQLRKIQMKARMNYITIQNSYQLPVNFVRIIEDAKNLVVNTKQERLNPIYVNHAIGFILRPDITRINILKKNFSETDVKYRDQTRAKYLLKVALMEYLSPRRCIFEYKLTKPQFDQMVYEIIRTFRKACVEPGEMVGTLTAQSLGETLTQMTLNSVSYSDQIYYKTENNCEIVKIGEMIDKLLENDKEKIIKIDNETKTEFLDVSKLNYMIPSVDENGKMHWKLIEAVTRHLPGGNVIKVKTLTGREVIATKSKSFLIRRNNKIVEIEGSSIKIGDKLPVQRNSPKLDQYLEYLDLSQYLSKKEYIYGSEVQKAIKHRDTCGLRCWFQDGNNKNLFVVPYQRSDSVGVGTQRNPELLTSTIILPHNAGPCSSKLTETILLDELCGFFFGAYLAEGCVNDTQVIISNNDESYRNKIALFADRYKIKYHTQIQHDKNFAGATSSDIRLHSTMLCKVINESCGRHAQNKHIPGWALIANNNFVKGLLDGYFSGDGTVNKRDTFICASSASKQLLIGISELLSRFGIMCKLSQHIMTHNNVGSEHIFPVNTLTIRNNNVNVFAKKIGFSLEYKQLLAEESYDKDWKTGNGRFDVIPGVNFGNFDKEYSRFELEELHVISTGHKKQIITDILNEDVYYDEITEITEAPLDQFTPDHDKVYDLTVADTKNFNMFGGLCMRDTFHSSGIGVKGMQGIPRFREILSYSKKISTPYMIIKLVPEVRADPNIAHKIEADLKHTLLGNLVDHMDIIYDPTPKNIHEKDKMNMKNIYYISGGNANIENFPWLYRFTISRESMLENDITLLDVKIKFIKYWEEFMNDTSATKKKNILSKIANGCIISNFDNSEQPTIHIRYDINNLDNFSLVEIGQHMLNKISMKGVATIEKVDKVEKQKVIEYDDNGGVKPDIYEYVIYTTGIDLNKIKTNKYINFNSTYINDINTIYVNFGIEAARTLIMKEIETAYSGNDINSAHGGLLADVMCNTGNITSIDRHGINRLDTDPLSRASFEKTVEQLITASAFNEVDHMRSVSSRIMAGRCIKGGTGFCDVFLDSEMLENSEYTKQKKYIEIRGAELEENSVIKDTLIRTEIQDIFIPV
jgi:DNA-directed RNA polymerase beta' subunit